MKMYIVYTTWFKIREELGEGATNQQVAERFCSEYIWVILTQTQFFEVGK